MHGKKHVDESEDISFSSDDNGEEFQEGDIPSSRDASKKTRPTHACDFCSERRVCSQRFYSKQWLTSCNSSNAKENHACTV
jgi:hypothetical protein